MKEAILKELKSREANFISGEELSERFGVSRTAVWKVINSLREQGYKIESVNNKGYKLVESPDVLNETELQEFLNCKLVGSSIIHLDSVDSTNNYAKKLANTNFEDGTVIIAEEQTAGKGRLGRNWVSPKNKGIWMTIMLKPIINPADAAQITLLAACAVCEAIREQCLIAAEIKWPNDIVTGGKKLCGILAEMNGELDRINYLIVGIGINANIEAEEFPEEISDIATSIKIQIGESINRKRLAAEILNKFDAMYDKFIKLGSINVFIDVYKNFSATLGKEVRVLYKNEQITGIAEEITGEGHLVLKMSDGSVREIVSGEVSVRGLYGYV